mmetsp:Transcript_53900/g.115101  ORF Transcript_53900/g.115101 Transcript_53900/m.115101 type:complete len:213 (-) Transcript_53900:437-1075(-)
MAKMCRTASEYPSPPTPSFERPMLLHTNSSSSGTTETRLSKRKGETLRWRISRTSTKRPASRTTETRIPKCTIVEKATLVILMTMRTMSPRCLMMTKKRTTRKHKETANPSSKAREKEAPRLLLIWRMILKTMQKLELGLQMAMMTRTTMTTMTTVTKRVTTHLVRCEHAEQREKTRAATQVETQKLRPRENQRHRGRINPPTPRQSRAGRQ